MTSDPFREAFGHMAKRAGEIARDFERMRWRWNGNPASPDAHEILESLKDLLDQVRGYLEDGQENVVCESGYYPAKLFVAAEVDLSGRLQISFGYKKAWND